MKKQIYLIAAFLFLFVSVDAQNFPKGMKYQAVARDNAGNILSAQTVNLKITLFSTSDKTENGRNIFYEEIHEMMTNKLGLFSLTIGQGEAETGKFGKIPWSAEEIWMAVDVDLDGGNNYSIISESQLLAVPYAIHALTASELMGSNGETNHMNEFGKGWLLYGNLETNPAIHFLGTIDNTDLIFRTNNIERGSISNDGDFQIQNNITIDGNSFVGGNSDVQGSLIVANNGRIGNDLNVRRNLDVDQNGNIDGELYINDDLWVNGATNINQFKVINGSPSILTGTLGVDGVTDLNNTLNVNGGSATNLSGDLNVTGSASFNSQVTFDIDVAGDQTAQASYPVIIKGSKQGLAIDLVPAVNNQTQSHRGNNYISFYRNGVQKGRIEGMSQADLDISGLCNMFVSLINTAPAELASLGITYDPFAAGLPTSASGLMGLNPGLLPSFTQLMPLQSVFLPGSLPYLDIDFPSDFTWNSGSLPSISDFNLNSILNPGQLPNLQFPSIQSFVGFQDPFSTGYINSFCNLINSPNGEIPSSPLSGTWNTIKSTLLTSNLYSPDPDPINAASQLYSDYSLDFLQQGISTTAAVITFAGSFTSVLDPDDIFGAALGLTVEVTNFTLFASYAHLNLGVAYESGAGDYAEWLERANPDERISHGDVVGVVGAKISKEFTNADQFMVVSTSPLLLGNMPENAIEEQLSEKVAFMGQVPVKVQGEVNIGDYILPSGVGDGLGIAISPEKMMARDYQRIVGVAWENGDPDEFINLINTAVGVNHNDLAKVVEEMQFTLNHIQDAVKKMDPSFVAHDYVVSQESFQEKTLDYSVSATHQDKVSAYFAEQTYHNNEEMLAGVKDALVNQAGIDLDDVPIVNYIFEHPEEAQKLVNYYNQLLEEMVNVRDDIYTSKSE